MRPIRYGQWKCWTDAYHGWRDGRAEIPRRLPKGAAVGPATTPHREALIRLAQDSFAYEHLEYRRLVAEPHRQIMAERARREAAGSALTWARSAFDLESGELTEPETRRRRLGEDHHPDTVIAQRRRKEHRKLLARAGAAVTRAQAELTASEANLEQAMQDARQHHEAAVNRVEWIHEHIHRRLAVYRRALVRVHPDGAWVNSVLSARAPEIPSWALPDAYLPEGVPQPSVVPPEEPEITVIEPDERPAAIIDLLHDVTRFGSGKHADGSDDQEQADTGVGYYIIDHPVAAPWHFTIVKADQWLELRTRGFGHGPYIGGEVVGTAILQPGDYFDFAGRRYTMRDIGHLEDAPLGKCDLVVDDLFAKSGKKVRLSGMSFVQRENTLLAVLGPSGAGKSSLFHALLGELPLESGRLFFREMSMATNSRQIREQLGFVPQSTDLHESLTVDGTLRYGFGLRASAARWHRDKVIDDVLGKVQLTEQRGQLFSTLSGGQQRRVSIALELLANPPLLLLDEPTSGLDANLDREIMTILRKHAEDGHTVIVVTHATEHLPLAHQIVVVVRNGAPAYSGAPRQIRRHFGFKSYADLMHMLFEQPDRWVDEYHDGPMVKEAEREAGELEQRSASESATSVSPLHNTRKRKPRTARHQFRVLIVRQCVLLLTRALTKNARDRTGRDKLKNGVIVSLPLIIAAGSAALAALVAAAPGLRAVPSPQGPTALTLLTTLCVLSGQALTYSDVVGEREIIQREFRAGVGAFPVLISKWLVYAVIAVGQAGLITVVFCLFPDRAPQRWVAVSPETDLFLSLAALSMAAMTLGLLLSAMATKLEHAVALVTLTSIAQIALNGITSDLSSTSVTSVFAGLLPDRWGLAAAASSIDLRGINQHQPTQVSGDALWLHSFGQWSQDLGALALLSGLFFTLAVWRLHTRLRPPKPARRRRA